jgi:hypothetical protein
MAYGHPHADPGIGEIRMQAPGPYHRLNQLVDTKSLLQFQLGG